MFYGLSCPWIELYFVKDYNRFAWNQTLMVFEL